jgi:hypothetical protein
MMVDTDIGSLAFADEDSQASKRPTIPEQTAERGTVRRFEVCGGQSMIRIGS